MLHSIICTVLALAFGALCAGLQDCTNTADRFTLRDTACETAHIGNPSRPVLVCTEVFRVR